MLGGVCGGGIVTDLHRLGLVSTRLRYFEAVARLGTIRAAAEQLNVAPSSISRIIALLESDLQVPLFERLRQRLRLTSAGELLLHHVRASRSALALGRVALEELKGLRRGAVGLAAVESVARGPLPAILSAFWGAHPQIGVDIRVSGAMLALASVADAEAELALTFDTPLPPGTRRIAQAELALGALMTPDHPLARRPFLRTSDLREERLLRSDTSLQLHGALAEAAGSETDLLPWRARTNSIGLMLDLASRGEGIAIQTRVGAEAELANGRLVFVRLRGGRLRPRRLLLVSRESTQLTRAASDLAARLAEALDRLGHEEAALLLRQEQ